MPRIMFDTNNCVMFDYRGMTVLPNGTAPHHPDQVRVVFNNATVSEKISDEDDAHITTLADAGDESALEQWINQNFTLGPRVKMAQ